MDGILNVNKPAGMTSHDVVAKVRRSTGIKRIGHAGTLDPEATGVLLLCLGRATRIVEYTSGWPKRYRAKAVFGIETDTEDGTGRVLKSTKCAGLTSEDLDNALKGFVGRISQVPPMVSAVHHEGERLYKLARRGIEVERPAREVDIYSIDMLSFVAGENPRAEFDVECSTGTYVRTLCADVGRALGCGAHMAGLVRTGVGRFGVEDSVTLEQALEMASEGHLGERVCSMDCALSDMPSVDVEEGSVFKIVNGVSVPVGCGERGVPMRMRGPDGTLLGIGIIVESGDGRTELRPEKVFAAET